MTEAENTESYFPDLTPENSANLFNQIDNLRSTISSAFNVSKIEFPDITTRDELQKLPPHNVNQVIESYVTEGTLFIFKKSENKYVKNTSYRLFSMWDQSQLEVESTHDLDVFINESLVSVPRDIIERQWINKVPYATIYSPEYNNMYGEVIDSPIIVVPYDWIELANEQPVLALSYLLRSATFARDDYYGKLQGSEWKTSIELRGSFEVPNVNSSKIRADCLVSNLLIQAYDYDRGYLDIDLKLDVYHSQELLNPYIGLLHSTIPNWYFYDDPAQSAWHYYPQEDEPPPYGDLP